MSVFLYHGVQETMVGNRLLPLNELFKLDPDLHAAHLKKYVGREEVLKRRIPLLDCRWNDVVQLLPLHPGKLFALQKQLGLIQTVPDYRYFEIDPAMLNPARTAVFFKTAPGDENVTIKWLADTKLEELQEVPSATVSYYKSMVGKNEPVFNYQFVPHIIYKGTIDISTATVISLG